MREVLHRDKVNHREKNEKVFYGGKSRLSKNICGVGYIGIGHHKSCENGKNSKAYQCWSNMIKRCYSDSRGSKNKSYDNCQVDDVWHNYQNFAEWYQHNHPNDGRKYHLDKDTKIDGNRTYSPDTCLFISPELNLRSNQKTYMLKNRDGNSITISNLKQFCRTNNLSYDSMCRISRGSQSSHKEWISVNEI